MPAGNRRVGTALQSWCKSGMNPMLALQANAVLQAEDSGTEREPHALWAVHASNERG